ncbi:FAD:protein FMN transferase [Pseudolysinimonas sp.]|uniref:FAD:protein FMN transferase n=1 Tax=Pseudolysinimonas sp. TaxID=2680009 RepID=UPI003F81D223
MSQVDRFRRDWTVWTCDASLVVTDAECLEPAWAIVRATLDEVGRACDRFDPTSELSLLGTEPAPRTLVSGVLADLVDRALQAAELTDGAVDPTLGREIVDLGYTHELVLATRAADGLPRQIGRVSRESAWRRIKVADGCLTVPPGAQLDLGATAKAVAVDRSVSRIATELSCGVLVAVGGDLATAGPAPAAGWRIVVRDLDDDPGQDVALAEGWAMATSSTQKRRWASGGYARHHILDPRSGLPADPVWRTVSVAAPSCLVANALSTGAVVTGAGAVGWLRDRGAVARLVDAHGEVVVLGGWPEPQAPRPAVEVPR